MCLVVKLVVKHECVGIHLTKEIVSLERYSTVRKVKTQGNLYIHSVMALPCLQDLKKQKLTPVFASLSCHKVPFEMGHVKLSLGNAGKCFSFSNKGGQ